MSTATDGTAVLPAVPAVAVAAAPPPAVPPHVLDVSVGDLRVPRAGRTYRVDAHDLPLLVEGPDGREVARVTRALRALQGEGLSDATLKAYAKSFLRAARPMWALGCDPARLTATEYAVVRNWLRLCQRTSAAPAQGDARRRLAGSTLVQTESALASIYAVAERTGLVEHDPVAALRGEHDDRYARIGFVTFDTDPAADRRRRLRNRTARSIASVAHKEIVVLEPGDRRALRHAPKPRNRALWDAVPGQRPPHQRGAVPHPEHVRAVRQPRPRRREGPGRRQADHPGQRRVRARHRRVPARPRRARLRPGPDEPIFRSLRAPYPPLTYDGAWKALRRALCRDDVHPHALRHTAATELLDLLDGSPGLRLERVRIILGHRSVATTQKYTHVTAAEVIAGHVAARRSPLRRADPVLRQTYDAAAMALLADIRKEHTP